ncbi:fibronectin type III domain-containing protein [Myxococcus landrumensis]|uniref:Fibronectin type III domain-containing protein n=1 Tax=Myxococcus landrumensis TaxID=2813577 RepID=A0ABX7N3N6_9BACT|nr:fibronectin type III domain-containing protein [Myxococcus landrumus]QSQ13101.1 fibronectin type III domain-containing protein [Myxococcus landrumus]
MRGRRLSWLLLGLCGAVVGCSDDPGGDGGGEEPAVRVVRVKSVQRHVTAAGIVEVPWGSTAAPVEMLRLDGEDSQPVVGTVGQDGVTVFEEAPEGTYYLRRGGSMVVTDAAEVDLSVPRLGRPDVESLENDLKVHVSVNGLEPWVGSGLNRSELDFMSEQVDAYAAMYTSAPDGATAVEDAAPNVWMALGLPVRLDGGAGDQAWILQRTPRSLETRVDGRPLVYDSVGRALRLPAFSYDGTGPLRLQGTLQSLAMKELSLDWNVSAFTALAADGHPSATGHGLSIQVFPAPHGLSQGWVGFSGWLLGMSHASTPPTVTGRLSYGNPYPSHWEEVASASVRFSVPVEPFGTSTFTTTTSIRVMGAPSLLAAKPLLPVVSPPRGLRVDGEEGSASRLVFNESLLVEWQPPALGKPNAYDVKVIRWVAEWGDRFERSVLTITLDGSATSVRIPKGTLVSGAMYLIRVEAIQDPGYDAKTRPFVPTGNATSGRADTVSGLITVL